MCLGIPAKLVEVRANDDPPMGKVEFGGILKDVCLAYTPEAQVGDYVLVHVGFAISRIDEAEAQETFDLLAQIAQENAPALEPQAPSPESQSPNPRPPFPAPRPS